MVAASEALTTARSRMLARGFNQLVVVDDHGGLRDILTERDLVLADANGGDATVEQAIAERGHLSVAPLPVDVTVEEAIDALRDERVGAVVLTDRGRLGEAPRGILTRSDVLQLL